MNYKPSGIVAELLRFGEEARHAHVRKAGELRERARLDANPRADGRHVSAWYTPEFKDSLPWPMFASAPLAYHDGRQFARDDKHWTQGYANADKWTKRAFKRGWATERANIYNRSYQR